jgi:putative redox protein
MMVHGTWEGGFRTALGDSTGHSVTVDLPSDEGGENQGPFALELAVMALAGCITTIFAIVAKKRRVGFERMEIALDWERPERSPTIASVNGLLRLVSDSAPEEAETVLGITLRTCPVGVLFERARIPVRVRLELVRSEARPPDAPRDGGPRADYGGR